MKNIKNPQFIYHIFIDRFSTGDEIKDKELSFSHTPNPAFKDYDRSFLGGNLRGIIKRFEHIKSLGADAIWISPFYKTSAYHGYHITDFFSIDKRFGNSNDLKELVRLCHDNDMKVILDFVPNHCSKHHPYFLDAQNNRGSQYRDWFIFKKWPNKYLCFLDAKDLPKLNLNNRDCRRHILDAARYWVEEFGIDGYRVDHAIGPPVDFWENLKSEIGKVKDDFFLIPEIWFHGIRRNHFETFYFLNEINGRKNTCLYLKMLFSGNRRRQEIARRELSRYFDGILDFTLSEFIRSNYRDAGKVKGFSERRNSLFPDMNNYVFIDNHDMPRFSFLCGDDSEKYKDSIRLMFSLGRPVVIYYGNEIGLSQKNHNAYYGHKDREFRRFMKWDFNQSEEEILNTVKEEIKKLK